MLCAMLVTIGYSVWCFAACATAKNDSIAS
jgi:hypothetical protein